MDLTFILEKIKKSKFLLPFIFGCLTNLAFAPFNFFLILFVTIPAFFLIIDAEEKNNILIKKSISFGFGYFLAGTYWISASLLVDAKSFAWLIPFAVSVIPFILSFYFTLLAILYNFIRKKLKINENIKKIIIFSFLWVTTEILRANLFGGFPWNLIGYSWLFSINYSQTANLYGIYGLSFFAILTSLLPIIFIKEHKIKKVNKKEMFFLIYSISIIMAGFSYGKKFIETNKIEYSDKKIRLIQANIKQELKWDEDKKLENFLKHINLSNKNDKDIEYVVWPESSIPYIFSDELFEKLYEVTTHKILITGALRFEKNEYKIWNSIFALNSEKVIDYYDKRFLVPFGEFIPFADYLPFVKKITNGAINFSQGKENKVIKLKDFSFAPIICYEIIFSEKLVDYNNYPDYLINITNDSWFGNTSGPYQHLNMSIMRSIEYSIPLVRVANTGISVITDPFGRIIKKINLNQENYIDFEIIKTHLNKSFYSKYKKKSLLIILLLFAPFIIFKRNEK